MKKIKILVERKVEGEFYPRDFQCEACMEQTGGGIITLEFNDYLRNTPYKIFFSKEKNGKIITKEMEVEPKKNYYLYRLEIKDHLMYFPEINHYRDVTGDEIIEYTFYDSAEEFNLVIYSEEGIIEKTTVVKFPN